ncbi:MAG: hypothetical protein IJ424_07715 [Oscillospiraceae bacterium]|nr:hypothetical protein [Oscillospiraceae bacterium]
MKPIDAHLMKSNEEFSRLRLSKQIEPWEDGLRTSGKFGEYEWWYSDIKIDGGASLVIVFFTAPMTATVKGFVPNAIFNLNLPDGREIKKSVTAGLDEAHYLNDHCDVKVGKCYIKGDLNSYVIHYEHEEIVCDVTLDSNIRSWRPETGHIIFGKRDYFAWLPSVPEGKASVNLSIGNEKLKLSGTGYHDHNWGNKGMFWLMHHWYWGRAKIGPYQLITSFITAREKYGYEHFPIFMLARDGEKIADNGEYVTYRQENPEYDKITNKHYFKKLTYEYSDGSEHYKIVYSAENVIERSNIEDSKTMDAAKTNAFTRLLLKAAGLEPAYIRFTGIACIEKLENGKVVEKHESPALWELMYFGKDADV